MQEADRLSTPLQQMIVNDPLFRIERWSSQSSPCNENNLAWLTDCEGEDEWIEEVPRLQRLLHTAQADEQRKGRM